MISTKTYSCCFLALLFATVASWAVETTRPPDANATPPNFVFGTGVSWIERWAGTKHWQISCPWFLWTTQASNKNEYQKIINYARAHGTSCVGFYYVATNAQPLDHYKKPAFSFPEGGIPVSHCQKDWFVKDNKGGYAHYPGNPNRPFLDVGRADVQEAILSRAIAQAKSLKCDALCLDNFYYRKFVPAGQNPQEWAEKALSFIMTARSLTNQAGLKLVVNTSTWPREWLEFSRYVDGFSQEFVGHPHTINSKETFEEELSVYESILSQGKAIFFWPPKKTKALHRRDIDGRRTASIALMVMPEDQKDWHGVYVSVPHWEVWPTGGWLFWPKQLGKPLGRRLWKGNTVTRKFERGSISITVGEHPIFSIQLNY